MQRLVLLSVMLLVLLGCREEDSREPKGGKPDTMNRTLHQASRAGDLGALRSLLDGGALVEAVETRTGYTALMVACTSPKPSRAVVKLLLERGANANALSPRSDDAHPIPVLGLAIRRAPLGVIEELIAAKADVGFRTQDGYTALTLAATAGRLDVLRVLREAGAPLDGESDWGESALSVLSREAEFGAVKELLTAGADPTPLQWTGLHHAVISGDPKAVSGLIAKGSNLETRDTWGRTPFLLALHAGDTEVASLLLEKGADRSARGRGAKPALHFAVDNDDVETLRWLIKRGFELNARDEFDSTPLMEAVEGGAVACFRCLLEAGANPEETDQDGEALIEKAQHPDIVTILIARGEDPARLPRRVLRNYIGLGTAERLHTSKAKYSAGRARVFGTKNPTPMNTPFWNAMVRCGWTAFMADEVFGGSADDAGPTWCHHRFGMSLTALPDGRFVQVAGEHEDSYDPDFCIYNDVIVHDGKGGFTIYGYPKATFPPTDFHTATRVGRWIYLIGSLGYVGARGTKAQVYRLDTTSFKMEPLATIGEDPGWISNHAATLDNNRIVITGGKVVRKNGDYVSQDGTFALDLTTLRWSRLESSPR